MPIHPTAPDRDREPSAPAPRAGIAGFASLTDNEVVMQMAEAKENLGFSPSVSASGEIRTNPTTSGALGALLAEVDALPRMELRRRFKREANALHGALDRFNRNGKHPVHADLHDLRAFLREVLTNPDLGPHPGGAYSLDRRDPRRGYEPGNLRWATKSEQSLNRPTTPMMPDRDGIPVPLTVMAKTRKKVRPATALKRHKRGWTPYEATSLPKGTRRASMQATRAARETGGGSVRAAWEVWSTAFLEAHGGAPPRWSGKEAGQVKTILGRLDAPGTDPLAILRWIVTQWPAILDRHFGWMRDNPPPSHPNVGFILGGRNLSRFHGAYLDAHSTRDIPAGPEGDRMRWLRAEGRCNYEALAILAPIQARENAVTRREAEVAAQEKHIAFLGRIQAREQASLKRQYAAMKARVARLDRASGPTETPVAHYVMNPGLLDPGAAGRIVPTMIAVPPVVPPIRHRTRSTTPPKAALEPDAA